MSDDIMTALLPEDAQEEIPVGFAIVGHVGKYGQTPSQDLLLKKCSSFQSPR